MNTRHFFQKYTKILQTLLTSEQCICIYSFSKSFIQIDLQIRNITINHNQCGNIPHLELGLELGLDLLFDRNVVPGPTKDVGPGICPTWLHHIMRGVSSGVNVILALSLWPSAQVSMWTAH